MTPTPATSQSDLAPTCPFPPRQAAGRQRSTLAVPRLSQNSAKGRASICCAHPDEAQQRLAAVSPFLQCIVLSFFEQPLASPSHLAFVGPYSFLRASDSGRLASGMPCTALPHASARDRKAVQVAWGLPRDQASPPPPRFAAVTGGTTAPTIACPPSWTTTRSTLTICNPLPRRRSIASAISTIARARFAPCRRSLSATSGVWPGSIARRKHSIAAWCSATA